LVGTPLLAPPVYTKAAFRKTRAGTLAPERKALEPGRRARRRWRRGLDQL